MKILMTVLACLVLGAAGAFAFIQSGIYDVSALEPDNALVAWVTHTTSERSVATRLSAIVVPPGLDAPAMVKAGAALYAGNCAVCHGGPGLVPSSIAQGLNPSPPDLFRATRKPDSAENFRFIKYGVKMTAMPGFGKTRPDAEIWSVVAFLGTLPGMTAEMFTAQTGLAATRP